MSSPQKEKQNLLQVFFQDLDAVTLDQAVELFKKVIHNFHHNPKVTLPSLADLERAQHDPHPRAALKVIKEKLQIAFSYQYYLQQKQQHILSAQGMFQQTQQTPPTSSQEKLKRPNSKR